MPRVLTAETAAQRGARRADGSSFTAPQKKSSENDTITQQVKVSHEFNPVDTGPIAAEIGKLAKIVAATLDSQAGAVERLSRRHEGPCSFEFSITERDYNGRIVKMVAKRIGGGK